MEFQKNLKPSPELKAGWLSKLFLCWIFPFLRTGAKKNLELDDIYQSLPQDSSQNLGALLEKKWKEELTRAAIKCQPPKLWKAMVRCVWAQVGLTGVGYLVDNLVFQIVQPLALRNFIQTFTTPETAMQYFYASVLVGVSFLSSILYHKLIGSGLYTGMRLRLGISSLIYRKTLKLGIADGANANVGKLCNLLSTDVDYLDDHLINIHFFYTSPLQLVLCTYLLYCEMGGVTAFSVLAIVFFLSPLQLYCSRWTIHFRRHIAQRTDERGRFVSEVVRGIPIIKMFAWEHPFSALIAKLRKAEVGYVRKSLYTLAVYVCSKIVMQKLVPFFGLLIYAVGVGEPLTADKAFFGVLVCGMMVQALCCNLPNLCQDLGVMVVSLNRVEQFLLSSGESGKSTCEKVYHFSEAETKCSDREPEEKGTPKVAMKNYSAGWTEDNMTLQNINVNLSGNKLVMVVGHVGSGKSSFLNAILEEMPVKGENSHCKVRGHLSYAAQEAWIFPASVRDNILFGLPLDKKRYDRILELCCLEPDLQQLPHGDNTLVGERGVALSGGQKTRVNFARALYQEADIYLMDDPLSAVDTNVSQSLFHQCIREGLEGTLRILVTHDLKYLSEADHIIVLNKNGGIWDQGSYEQLLNSGDSDLKSFISSKTSCPAANDNLVSEKMVSYDAGISKLSKSFGLEKPEQIQVGSVSMSTYLRYFRAGGACPCIFLVVLGFLFTQTLTNLTDYWLAEWTNAVKSESNEQSFYVWVYSGLIISLMIVVLARTLYYFRFCTRISTKMHKRMFGSVIRAPVKFFEKNHSGRIMNRFTKDLNQVDERLPQTLYDFVTNSLKLLGALALNISANGYTALPSVLFLMVLWKLRTFFLASSRDIKRLGGVTKSPLFTHVAMTLQGLSTIKALRAEERMLGQFDNIQNTHTSVWYMSHVANRWFALCLEMMTDAYMAFVTWAFVFFTTSSSGGSVGLAISAIVGLASPLQWGIRQSAETENCMTSVERILEYSTIPSEPPLESNEDSKIPKQWPNEGCVSFEKVDLTYNDTSSVLKGVSFSTRPREKIGVVGRTGAGKTSLVNALFRLTEPSGGQIVIDGVSTSSLGLHTLRSCISIIPQHPVLFSGSLRYNLDPFGEFPDDQHWNALRQVEMHAKVTGLDASVSDGGGNFSVGEKQLLCLARAILRKSRILVLDEPTANIDSETDILVQRSIRKNFAECTILTIAHRLQTVLDSDRILVMEAGQVVEFDSPANLLTNEDGYFYKMMRAK